MANLIKKGFWWLLLLMSMFMISVELNTLKEQDAGYPSWQERKKQQFPDFLLFHIAPKIVTSGEGQKIYDFQTQLEYFNKYSTVEKTEKVMIMQSPPHFVLLLIPFSLLPLFLAIWLWRSLGIGASIFALTALARSLQYTSTLPVVATIFAYLSSYPGMIAFIIGQTTWLMAAAWAAFFLCFFQRKDIMAGFTLILIAIKLQYLPFFLLALLLSRRWKTIIVFSISMAVICCAAMLLLGWENVLLYPKILFHAETSPLAAGVWADMMINFRGLLSNFVPREFALVLSIFSMLAGLPASYVLMRNQNTSSLMKASAASIFVLLVLPASAHTHFYDSALIVIPAALSIIISQAASTNLSKVCMYALLIYPLFSWMLIAPFGMNFGRIPVTISNLLLLVLTIWNYRQLGRSQANSPTNQTHLWV